MGTGSNKSRVAIRIYFSADPGYKETARMVVEGALVIALTPEKCSSKGGILTPAACQGEEYLNRLIATGTEFAVLHGV